MCKKFFEISQNIKINYMGDEVLDYDFGTGFAMDQSGVLYIPQPYLAVRTDGRNFASTFRVSNMGNGALHMNQFTKRSACGRKKREGESSEVDDSAHQKGSFAFNPLKDKRLREHIEKMNAMRRSKK